MTWLDEIEADLPEPIFPSLGHTYIRKMLRMARVIRELVARINWAQEQLDRILELKEAGAVDLPFTVAIAARHNLKINLSPDAKELVKQND